MRLRFMTSPRIKNKKLMLTKSGQKLKRNALAWNQQVCQRKHNLNSTLLKVSQLNRDLRKIGSPASNRKAASNKRVSPEIMESKLKTGERTYK